MKKSAFVCAFSFILAFAFIGCNISPASVVNDTVQLDEFDTLDIKVSSYDLIIVNGDSYSLEYVAASGREPEVSQNGGKLRITQPSGFLFGFFSGGGVENAHYKITVPADSAQISLTAKASSGDVSIEGLKVSGQIKTSSGNVDISDVEGNIIETETSSGDVSCDKIRAGAASAGTSSGKIDLSKIEADDISCNSSSGEISISDSIGRNVMCQASSGDVKVSLHGSTEGFSYYADSSSGSITVNGQEAKKEFVKDDGKDGKVAVRTSSGDIEINVQ